MNAILLRAIRAFTPSPVESLTALGQGHINHTYLIHFVSGELAVLQQINTRVFTHPVELMTNLQHISQHLKKHLLNQTVLHWWTVNECPYVVIDNNYYRICDYIADTVTYQVAPSLNHIVSMGQALGDFHLALSDFKADSLFETLPHFHDTPQRILQLMEASITASDERRHNHEAQELVAALLAKRAKASSIRTAMIHGNIPQRVTHNDTKVNNFLFAKNSTQVIALVDWDTIMPGTWLDDIGDALRSLGNLAAEDEQDSTKIQLNVPAIQAFLRGYLSLMKNHLSNDEKNHLVDSLWTITYELSSRFLTDYLNGDVYFRTHYPTHNLVRARAQYALLQAIEQAEDSLTRWVTSILEL